MRALQLEGQRFGRLVVQCRAENSQYQQSRWVCLCDCGATKTVGVGSLRSGRTRSCGCYARESIAKTGGARLIDLTGKRFGQLTVLSRALDKRRGCPRWLCRCDCGRETTVAGSSLRDGVTHSCGCLAAQFVSMRAAKHRAVGTPEYEAWHSIKQRCFNPNHKAWKNYGGRGITVCGKWADSFEVFFADVGPKPNPNATLDRIDNEGDYRPGNVRWASWQIQNRTQRRKCFEKVYR